MIADRSNPVRTVSRTKGATCPEGTKSWIDGGSSQTWSTSQARNVLLIPRLNHDAPSSSRKIRLLGQATSECKSARSLTRPLCDKFLVQPASAVVAPPNLSAHKPTGNCSSRNDDRM